MSVLFLLFREGGGGGAAAVPMHNEGHNMESKDAQAGPRAALHGTSAVLTTEALSIEVLQTLRFERPWRMQLAE